MLSDYYVKPATIDRIRACWLGAQIEAYVQWMRAHGYRDQSVHHRVPVLCCFAEFARCRRAADLASAHALIDDFAVQWLRDHGSGCRSEPARTSVIKEARSPVRQMLDLAMRGEIVRHRARKPFPFADEAPEFVAYLQQERGLREATIEHYAHDLSAFHGYCLQVGAGGLSALSPALLASFVVDRCPRLSASSRRNLCGTVRVFLRYCFRERLIGSDLSAAVEMPQSYRLADVPRAIGWDDVARMLAAVDRRTGKGRRDYAVLLLLVTYGLRGHEVAKLRLDDIDWEREQLRVPDRKAGHCTAYPLASVVGQAIIDYLKQGRPTTTERQLFFRVVAPSAPITAAAIASAVSFYLGKAGVQVPRAGSHTLRHTCVQRLIDAEFPLKTIGDYVGHRSPDSTAIYTKVALASLREVAMGDGEAL